MNAERLHRTGSSNRKRITKDVTMAHRSAGCAAPIQDMRAPPIVVISGVIPAISLAGDIMTETPGANWTRLRDACGDLVGAAASFPESSSRAIVQRSAD